MNRVEAMLEKELQHSAATEAAPLIERALAEQANLRHIGRTLPSRRELEHVVSRACRHLDRAASGQPAAWLAFIDLARSNTYLKARTACAWQTLPDDASFADFVASMRRQRDQISKVQDYARMARVEFHPDRTLGLQHLLPARKNASPAQVWEEVVDFLLCRGVRPSRIAEILAPVASVSTETMRSWVAAWRKEKRLLTGR